MAAPEPTLEELITPITRAEFETSLLRVMGTVGIKTAGWKPGAVARAIIVAASVCLAALSKLISLVARSGFLELATGPWLTLLAYYIYGVTRPVATYATGTVWIRNNGGGVFNEGIGDLRVYGANGQEYVSTETFSIAANDSTTGVYVTVRAVVSGTNGGNALAGTIVHFVGTYSGLTVTNPTAFNASDEATDPELRSLCRASIAAVSPNGPREAYEYTAKTAVDANGDSLGVNRVRVVRGIGDGNCTVYCATASGSITGAANEPTTALGMVQTAINAKAVPTGNSATAASATAVVVNVAYEVWIYVASGLTENEAESSITEAVRLYIATRQIGGDHLTFDAATGYVFIDKLRAIIMGAIADNNAFHCVVTTPSADVACSVSAVPVAGSITGTIHLVSG